MNSWKPGLFGHWFVAARADRLGRKPLAVTVLDRPLVLGRTPSDQLFAFEDRCPHRHAPLSQGRIVEQGIQCPYHGWIFDGAGRCVTIPGLPMGACVPSVGARAVSVMDIDGLIWVRLSAVGDEAPPRMVRDLEPGSRKFLEQTRWGANVVDAMENFLDPMHTHLIHPGLVRKDAVRHPVSVTMHDTDEGFMIDYQGQPEQSGLLYRLFESPRTHERAHLAGAGMAQLEYRYRNGSVVRIILYFTPESADSTHVFTSMHVENRWAPPWALRLFVWPFLRKVGEQDKAMLEMQSANLKRFPASKGVSTQLDLVRAHLDQVWKAQSALVVKPAPHQVTFLL